jgi:hypothetical protein
MLRFGRDEPRMSPADGTQRHYRRQERRIASGIQAESLLQVPNYTQQNEDDARDHQTHRFETLA